MSTLMSYLRSHNNIFEQLKSSEKERKTLLNQLKELDSEKKIAQKKVEVVSCLFHKQVNEKKEELLIVKAKNDSLKIQLKSETEEVCQLKEQVNEKDMHLNDIKSQLDQEKISVTDLKKYLVAGDEDLGELKNSLENEKAVTKRLNENVEQLRDENTKLRSNIRLHNQNETNNDSANIRKDFSKCSTPATLARAPVAQLQKRDYL